MLYFTGMDKKVLNYRIIIEPEKYADGKTVYTALCPTLDVADYGDSIEEVLLQKLGFAVVGQKGSHVHLAHSDGRWTQVAVHPKPIPQGTLRAILRQAEISVEKLTELL